MRLMNRKPEDDMAQKWLNELQNRFELNAEEANDLYALTRTCFAHNFGEADFKTVVLRYLSQTGKKVTPDAIDTSSMFIYRAGGDPRKFCVIDNV